MPPYIRERFEMDAKIERRDAAEKATRELTGEFSPLIFRDDVSVAVLRKAFLDAHVESLRVRFLEDLPF